MLRDLNEFHTELVFLKIQTLAALNMTPFLFP